MTFALEVSKCGGDPNRARIPVEVPGPFVNTVKVAHECATVGP